MSTIGKKPRIVTNRRQLLQAVGVGALVTQAWDPLQLLGKCLVDGLIARAEAQSTFEMKSYVPIAIVGAPPQMDVPLNLNGEAIVPNASFNTRLASATVYTPGRAAGGWRSAPVVLPNGSTKHLPDIWHCPIPLHGGGTTPAYSLLADTIVIPAADAGIDQGHVTSPALRINPIGGVASISGRVADGSTRPMPGAGVKGKVNYGDPKFQAFRSRLGTPMTLVNGDSDLLAEALGPFVTRPDNVTSARTRAQWAKLTAPRVDGAMSAALAALGQYVRSGTAGADNLARTATSATQLMRRAFNEFTDLSGAYNALYAKYENLMLRCARTPIPYIIPVSGTGGYDIQNGAVVTQLAKGFAVAEFLIVNGLSSVVQLSSLETITCNGLTVTNDEHSGSADGSGDNRAASVICQSFLRLSLYAMINELKRVLIAAGKWNDTVVEVYSEYGRWFQGNGSGSEHLPASGGITIHSGAITAGPLFIGNVLGESFPGTANRGSFAEAAATVIQGQSVAQKITSGHVANSVAALLGVEPISNAPSLISVNSSGVGVTALADSRII